MSLFIRSALAIFLCSLCLSGCGERDPQKSEFLRLCTSSGDTNESCNCSYDLLAAEVEQVDDEFVFFVADFAKWGLAPGDPGLDRDQMMAKYSLSEEDFRDLTEIVGSTMMRAFNTCGAP